jgi:hypothetical protein
VKILTLKEKFVKSSDEKKEVDEMKQTIGQKKIYRKELLGAKGQLGSREAEK